MSPESVPIPPAGALASRDVTFHSLHDVAMLREDGSPTPFFQNPFSFEDGTGKLRPQESNLEGPGGGLPRDQAKILERVVLHVRGATPDDVFHLRVLVSRNLIVDEDVRVGWANNAKVVFSNAEGESDYIVISPQEMLEVFVTAPERLRGAYAQVSLWGPLSVLQG